jgi:transglutaminase-like putative cysteine protease
MRLALTHRRLTVLMAMASLLAFAGGAGVEPLSAILAAVGLVTALVWQPDNELSGRMDRFWLPLALLLVVRTLVHVFLIRDDIVIPVVDLLFLLLIAEALRSLEADNDSRLYSLSFALLLASTAYRPGLLFALAFTAYVGLATVALMVGHLRRQGEKHGTGEIPIPRAFLLTTATLSGVILLFSAMVFLTFPRVSQGWAGRGQPLATSIVGFADEVSLGSHGSQIFGNPEIVLRVAFPGGAPTNLQSLYWRGRSYDRFDGVRWSRSSRLPPSLAPSAWYERWGGEILEQEIYGAPLDVQVLFALHPLMDVDPQSRIQPIFDNAGDYVYWGSATPVYTAYSLLGRPSPEQLRSAESGFIPSRQYFLQLPELSEEMLTLADSILDPAPTRYDKALSLVQWFQADFTYTLNLPATPREATLEHFLFQRRAGHCEYFSTAMAILLRSQGIPAREVNGFLGGEWSDFGDYLAVTQNQAHAWVEVWFPDYGWVPFDPTPSGTGEGLAINSWFWPGRFLFDALQHRWNRWVLDYSMENQFGLLQAFQEFFSQKNQLQPNTPSGGERGLPGGTLWWIAGTVILALGFLRTLRRRGSHPETTRLFLKLRAAGRRGGVPGNALHSPQSLTRHLNRVRHPAAPWAQEVVDGYLEDRFSGHPLQDEAVEAMRSALEQARRALRGPWTSHQDRARDQTTLMEEK